MDSAYLVCVFYAVAFSITVAAGTSGDDSRMKSVNETSKTKAILQTVSRQKLHSFSAHLENWFQTITGYSTLSTALVKAAEASADSVVTRTKAPQGNAEQNEEEIVDDTGQNEDISYLNLKRIGNATYDPFQESGVHIPVDIWERSDEVRRDVNWTSELLTTFLRNAASLGTSTRQYVSLQSGITRIFPAFAWKRSPPNTTVDLFDPRFRSWYIHAITSPKDIIIMMDFSGSVHGRTLRLMKLTVLFIMSTLSENDFVNIVWYNSGFGEVLKLLPGFVQATSRNKLLLERRLNLIEDQNEADFKNALQFALQKFEELDRFEGNSNYSGYNYGSGGHKMVLVLTDATEGYHDSAYRLYAFSESEQRNTSVRFFGIAMGTWIGDVWPLQAMACVNKGYYGKIGNLESLKYEASAYLKVLARSLAMHLRNIPVEDRDAVWTGPYMDAQGDGPMITLSMPLVNTLYNSVRHRAAKTNQTFLGVAAIDIQLSEIEDLIRKTVQLDANDYVFITENNGNLILHPDMKLPQKDLYMVRRTVCSPAFKDQRTVKNVRTLYSETTEATLKQMGLLDSIPTKGLLEAEEPTDELLDMRRAMIDQTCADKLYKGRKTLLIDQRRSVTSQLLYSCQPITGTIFSFAVASSTSEAEVHSSNLVPKEVISSCQQPVSEPLYLDLLMPPRLSLTSNDKVAQFLNEIICNNTERESFQQDPTFWKRVLADIATVLAWERQHWLKHVETTIVDFASETGTTSSAELRNTNYHGSVESNQTKSACSATGSIYDNSVNVFPGVISAFVQLPTGLTAVYPKCSRFQPTLPNKDLMLSSGSPDNLWISVNENSETRNHHSWQSSVVFAQAVRSKNTTIAVAGVAVELGAFRERFTNITVLNASAKPSVPSEAWYPCDPRVADENVVCYLVDNTGMVILSTPEYNSPNPNENKFSFIGEVDPQLANFLIEHNYFQRTFFKQYDGDCELAEEGHFINRASSIICQSLLTMVSRLWISFSTLLCYFCCFPFVLLPRVRAQDIQEPPRCDFVAPPRTETCVLNYTLYKLNVTQKVIGQLMIGSCVRRIELNPIPKTNAYLIHGDGPCPCDKNKRQYCQQKIRNTPVRADEIDDVKIEYRRRRPVEPDLFNEKEDFSVCSAAAVPRFRASPSAFALLILIFHLLPYTVLRSLFLVFVRANISKYNNFYRQVPTTRTPTGVL